RTTRVDVVTTPAWLAGAVAFAVRAWVAHGEKSASAGSAARGLRRDSSVLGPEAQGREIVFCWSGAVTAVRNDFGSPRRRVREQRVLVLLLVVLEPSVQERGGLQHSAVPMACW